MSKATLQRRPLVRKILEGADDNLLVIAGLGSSNWDITEAGDRPLNMPLWGAMGATVGIGLESMRRRTEELGGRFTIGRAGDAGTQVQMEVPM